MFIILLVCIALLGHFTVNAGGCRWSGDIPKGTVCPSPYGTFIFQLDGNVCIYDNYDRVLWNTGTAGRGHTLNLQSDGNLVVYDKELQAAWSSGTPGSGGVILIFQDDCNLCMYTAGDKKATWCTNTHPRNI